MNGRAYLKLKGCPKCGGDILVDSVAGEGTNIRITYPRPGVSS